MGVSISSKQFSFLSYDGKNSKRIYEKRKDWCGVIGCTEFSLLPNGGTVEFGSDVYASLYETLFKKVTITNNKHLQQKLKVKKNKLQKPAETKNLT